MMKIKTLLMVGLFGVVSLWTATAASSGYLPGSKLSITIACPAAPASDPTFSFTLTNLGSTPVEVSQQAPITIMVHLTVKNSKGTVVEPEYFDTGIRGLIAPRVLEPGKSLVLDDWVRMDQPRTTVIPIHYFGYKLAPGTYTISAKATDSPDEPPSNVCQVPIN
jgi:hypothetical protein